MKKILLALCVLAVAAGMQAQWTVQTVPNPRNTDAKAYVANPDTILSADDVAKLTEVSTVLYQHTGVELVTVVLNDIGDEDSFDFSYNLFNRWGIGDKETNTGVLIFLAVKSRRVEIRTGDGVEGLLPDIVCGEILDDNAVPYLKNNEWGKGMVACAIGIYNHLTTDAAQTELLLGYHPAEITESPFHGLSIGSIILVLFSLLVHFCRAKCPNCKHRDAKCHDTVEQKATYSASGLGTHHYTCRHCGHQWAVPYTIDKLIESSYSSSSSGRSSSRSYSSRSYGGSFGGGHSSGGGAGRSF